MSDETAPAVEDDDVELISSARQLGDAPELDFEPVIVPSWKTRSSKKAKFLVWELGGDDFAEFMEEGRIYKDGVIVGYDKKNEDMRFLSWTIRDAHNNRIWPTFEAAKLQLSPLGKAKQNLLIAAANRMNSGDPASAEGNSEKTPTDS